MHVIERVWFLSYSQSKCAMSDRAHEGALEFQRDYSQLCFYRAHEGIATDVNGSKDEIVFQKLQNFWVAKALMSS